jgi:uncharacterized protein YgiM (DUF1202 family)
MKLRKLMIPALLSTWFLLQPGTLAQAYSGFYYVRPSSVSLRECPANDCALLLTVYQSEKVEILERTTTGWSKVRLVERSALGWIPSDFLSYSPDLKDKPVSSYYVNISSLDIRDKPNPNANILITLHFNDPVEMLGVGTSGWAQVRDLRSSLVGWAAPRYLSSAPFNAPKSSYRRRAPARKAVPKEEEKAPEETPKLPSPM